MGITTDQHKNGVMFRYFISCLLGFMIFITASYADTMLEGIDGTMTSISSLQGKWVFINYWASWCHPCLDEIGELNRFYEANKSGSVAVYAVNFDKLSSAEQRDLVKKFSIHYPSLQRNSLAQLHLGPISVVPVTFVLNPDGKLATVLYGGQTVASLNEVISDQERPLKPRA